MIDVDLGGTATKDSVERISPEFKRGAFLGAVDFDPMEFGVPPNIMPATDTAQLLALIVVQKVLEDATHGAFSDVDRGGIHNMIKHCIYRLHLAAKAFTRPAP